MNAKRDDKSRLIDSLKNHISKKSSSNTPYTESGERFTEADVI